MWKSIRINENLVQYDTGKAVLIACPHSTHNGWVFWHPAKLVRYEGGMVTISYTDDFAFELKKYGKSKFNKREVIDHKFVTAADFEDIFEMFYNENPTLHTPPVLQPENSVADESLLDT